MITNYFIKRKIRSLAIQSPHRPHHSISWDKAHSILIFYTIKDHESIKKILNDLRREKKEVHTCVYVPTKDTLPSSTDKRTILILEKKDVNIWGFPSKNTKAKLKAIQADILIDLSHPDCLALQYAALLHACTFKVGINYTGQAWYDLGLSLTDKKDISYLFEQILYYLRSIRSK